MPAGFSDRAADGHRAIRGTLHDGLQLARHLKAAGCPIGLFDGADVAACRMYAGFAAAWRGFARNAYEALGSPTALAVMVTLNGGLFVLPFAALPWAWLTGAPAATTLLWAGAVALALGIRTALVLRFGTPRWTIPLTPLAVAAMIGIQLHAFVRHATGQPVVWRARAYPGTVPSGPVKKSP